MANIKNTPQKKLIVARKELALQKREIKKLSKALVAAHKDLALQQKEKGKRAAELGIANKELVIQHKAKSKRAMELGIANIELAIQDKEKGKRAAELSIANKELIYQNKEKGKRAAELSIANKELVFQNNEKEKRATELIIANKELAFQNSEKGKRAAELNIANKELLFQNDEKEKRAAELVIANKELAFQNSEKEKRAAELKIANYARSLIEASLDPLFTISPSGKITDMNDASINITGLSREQLLQTDFFDYFTEPDKAREVYQEVFAKGFVTDYPLTIRDKELTDVLFYGSVYKDGQGQVVGAVVVARDITEQKLIAKELTEAIVYAEMATEIAEIAKGKAESATQIAEDAMQAKQQFLSNMSHEIRTPMNAIIGFTKVILKTELTAKQKEYLTAIKMSGDALIVLINDILDLAKVDAGKMTFEQTPFNMATSIAAMLHLFETKIQEKNLQLVREYDSRIPSVVIGLNLMSNAVKFTAEGRIIVQVKLLSEDEEAVTIQFSVSDTGIGVREDDIEKIFETFRQASSGTARLYEGTGLGLAIVKQLVTQQGGSIQVKSEIDQGSTFSFTLTFKKTKEMAEFEAEIVEFNKKKKNIKVLVVEDMALNQLLMKTLLDDFGFERDIASNGKVAIEKLKANTYDIILMDLQMPIMSGFEATEFIRTKMNSNIPIIALTADVTTVDLDKCKGLGMNDYIAKPVDERLLYSKIIGLVNQLSSVKKEEEKQGKYILRKSEKFVNLNYLSDRTKSNPTYMSEMISIYLDQTPPLISGLKKSFQENDWESLQEIAHKLIPSFSIMGIHADYENMVKIIQEFAINQKRSGEIKTMVAQLEHVCEQACRELNEELIRIKNLQS